MEEFIILYINSQIICKFCLDVMNTKFVDGSHNKIEVSHGRQDYKSINDRCIFVEHQKEVSYKIFEIK